MINIAKLSDGKVYVIKSEFLAGILIWNPISDGYQTYEQAQAKLFNLVWKL